jgi:Virulence activator alpha C-term
MFALEAVDIDSLRADIMARLEHHRDRQARYERILAKRFPDGTAPHADLGKLLNLRLGVRHERAVVEWCEEALEVLPSGAAGTNVTPISEAPREGKG